MIEALIVRYGVPDGFRQINWRDVVEGQYVYLFGTERVSNRKRRSIALGPMTVISSDDRLLENKNNRRFRHYPQDLLVKVGEPLEMNTAYVEKRNAEIAAGRRLRAAMGHY